MPHTGYSDLSQNKWCTTINKNNISNHAQFTAFNKCNEEIVLHSQLMLQQLPITRDLSPSNESEKGGFRWTSIKQKPLKLV